MPIVSNLWWMIPAYLFIGLVIAFLFISAVDARFSGHPGHAHMEWDDHFDVGMTFLCFSVVWPIILCISLGYIFAWTVRGVYRLFCRVLRALHVSSAAPHVTKQVATLSHKTGNVLLKLGVPKR